jgi:hypothetical protein
LMPGDDFSGSLTRDIGENVGLHAIKQGGLHLPSYYTLTFEGAQLTISKRLMTITATGPAKVYGQALPTGTSTTNFTATDGAGLERVTSVTLTPDAAGLSPATAAGMPYVVTPSEPTGSNGFDATNYAITYLDYPGTTGKATAIFWITAGDKVYDGFDNAVITNSGVNGLVVDGDVKVTSKNGRFADKNAGTGKVVTADVDILPGSDLDNYTVTPTAWTTADITPKAIYGNFTADNKPYDGNSNAVVLIRNLNGIIWPDVVSLDGGTATFNNPTIANNKPVKLNGATLKGIGLDAANYSLDSVAATKANITPASLTITAVPRNKTYGQAITLNPASQPADYTVTGLVAGDVVSGITLTCAGAVATAAVGTYPITPSAATGEGLGKYTITYTDASMSVSQKDLNITVADTLTKTYGSTYPFHTANPSPEYTVNGLVGITDAVTNVTLSSVGAGATAMANLVPYVVEARDAEGVGLLNYHIIYNYGKLTVTPRTLNIWATDRTKVYGTTVTFAGTEFTVGSGDLVNGNTVDRVTLVSEGAAATAAIATWDIIPSAAVGSILTSNYTIQYHVGHLTVVGKLNPNVSVTGSSLPYDATPHAATGFAYGSGGVSDILSPAVTFSYSGTGGTTYGPNAAAPTNAGNYTVTASFAGNTTYNPATNTASIIIQKANVSGSFTAANKAYDGNISATVLTRSLSGVLSADAGNVILDGGTATFDTPTAGNGKTVTLTGAGLTGSAAGNYSLSFVATTTANITGVISITGNFTVSNKIYDGNNIAAVLTRTLTGVLPADEGNVTLTGGTATFSNENVANNKTVTLTGATLTGSAAGKYTLSSVTTTTANITRLSITGNFTASDKVYNRSTNATVLTRTLPGAIPGDAVTLTGGTATFNNRNAGIGKTVTLSGASLSGTDAGNYTLTGVATTTASITPLGLTGRFTTSSKVYNGNTTATVLTRTLTGVISGDNVAMTGGTATFDTKNVGNNKTVTLAGAGLTGSAAGNYALASVLPTTANITRKSVTGSFTAANKLYDGNTTATVLTTSLTGAISGDNVALTGTATFNTASVGTNKTVTLNAATLTGTDAGNYTLTSVATTTASIFANTPISVRADAKTKVYGSFDPALTYQITSGSLNSGESFVGSLNRVAGENVATYAIQKGTLALNSGRTVNFTSANLTISRLGVTVTANAQTKRQGDADPVLTYVSNPAVGTVLANGQIISFTGSLTRVSGESRGTYDILIGSLNNSNYIITFTPGVHLTIVRRFFNLFGNNQSANLVTSTAKSDNLTDSVEVAGNEPLKSEVPIGNVMEQIEPKLNVYPNPFTDRLFFELQLPADANVVLEIYSITGVKIARIFSDDVKANTDYRIEYTTGNVSSGILIYRLYINGRIAFTGKAIHKL